MVKNTKKLALVLGMHRSGTSVISRSLKIFGAEHGDNLLPFITGNAKGHWEDKDFYFLNDEMLNFVGKTWNSALPVSNNDVEMLCASGFMEKATKLLNSRFANIDFFALKEPRITKLLLFWDKIFENTCNTHYIFVIRNPISVAHSLQKRSNLPLERGLLLWYSYNAYALQAIRNRNIFLLDYDDFLHNPHAELERMSQELGVIQDKAERKVFLQGFLDKNLRNFNSSSHEKYSDTERIYINFYKRIKKNMGQSQFPQAFFEAFKDDVIYNTLEQMSFNALI